MNILDLIKKYHDMCVSVLESTTPALKDADNAEIMEVISYVMENPSNYNNTACSNAQVRLFYGNTGFVADILNKVFKVSYTNPEYSMALDVGRSALLEAASSFKLNKGAKFITYARYYVLEKCGDYLRTDARLISIPRTITDNIKAINRGRERFIMENDCNPTDSEEFEYSGLTLEKYLEAKRFSSGIHDLDYRIGTADDNKTLGDYQESDVLSPEERCFRNDIRDRLVNIINSYKDRISIGVLAYHYNLVPWNGTQEQYANMLGLKRTNFQAKEKKLVAEVESILDTDGYDREVIASLSND